MIAGDEDEDEDEDDELNLTERVVVAMVGDVS